MLYGCRLLATLRDSNFEHHEERERLDAIREVADVLIVPIVPVPPRHPNSMVFPSHLISSHPMSLLVTH